MYVDDAGPAYGLNSDIKRETVSFDLNDQLY